DHQAVVIDEFGTGGNVVQGIDGDAGAVLVFSRLAVGRARVIEPARVIAALAAVDHEAAAERKIKRVAGVVGVDRPAGVGLLGREAAARIAQDAGLGGDVPGGEHAHAVQRGFADDVPGTSCG